MSQSPCSPSYSTTHSPPQPTLLPHPPQLQPPLSSIGPSAIPSSTVSPIQHVSTPTNSDSLHRALSLTVFSFNARSIFPKFEELCLIISVYNPDIICICETWPTPDTLDSEISLLNYSLFRKDHLLKMGGGVALYAKVCLSPLITSLPASSPPIEFILISINYLNVKYFIGCFYHPPNHPQDSLHLLDMLSSCSFNLSNNLLLFSDFNHNILHSYPPSIQHLVDFYSLVQVIHSPTRYSAGHSAALDLAFIPMSTTSSYMILPPVSNSDHQSISISVFPKSSSHPISAPPSAKTIHLYSKANFKA